MLLRDRKRWRINKLDNAESDEQKCTQKIRILLWQKKKWGIKLIDELNDDELDEFYCTYYFYGSLLHHKVIPID